MGITIKTKKSRILVCIILFDFVCAVYAQNPPSQGSLEQILGQPEVQKKIEQEVQIKKQSSRCIQKNQEVVRCLLRMLGFYCLKK